MERTGRNMFEAATATEWFLRYPGEMHTKVRYTLTEGNRIEINMLVRV